MAKFTKIPADTFKQLQINAGVVLSEFTPATGTFEPENQIGATTGGVTFSATPTYSDYGSDLDYCPKNTMEMKRMDDVEVKLAGTYVTATTASAKSLMAAADIDGTDTTKVVPRRDLSAADFADIWLVGDYSDKNGATNGGFIAIRLMNALSTGGFQLKTAVKNKGHMAFEYTAHYSMSKQDVVPYEVYIKAGTAET